MAEDSSAQLLAVADELYGLPLAEFTPARDGRAKELRKQDAALSARVKALRKPATAAWVVDLLVRRETDQVDQVLTVGEALRQAQAAMSGEELRALTRQRRQLTAAVTARARQVAREAGTRVTDAVAEQVEGTLTAAMLDERCAQAVRSGLLVAPLTATGLGAEPAGTDELAEAVAVPEALGFRASASARPAEDETRPELHVVPDPEADRKAAAAARQVLEDAERELTEARDALAEATSDVERLRARTLQLQAELEELRGRIAELESSAEEVEDELADAQDSREQAERAVREASRERDEAAAALDRLTR